MQEDREFTIAEQFKLNSRNLLQFPDIRNEKCWKLGRMTTKKAKGHTYMSDIWSERVKQYAVKLVQ